MNIVVYGNAAFAGEIEEALESSLRAKTDQLAVAIDVFGTCPAPAALVVSFEHLGHDPLSALMELASVHAAGHRTVIIALPVAKEGEMPMIEAMTRLDVFWKGAPAVDSAPDVIRPHLGHRDVTAPSGGGEERQAATTMDVATVTDQALAEALAEDGEEIQHLSLDSSGKSDETGMIEQVRADLRAHLTRLRNVAPHVVLGVKRSASSGEVDAAYYRLMRDHHPDVYAHIVDDEVARLAEDVFLEIRQLRSRIGEHEEGADAPEAPQARAGEEAAAQSGRVKVTYVPQPEVKPEVETPDDDADPARRSTSRMRAIAELARARKEEAMRDQREQEEARAVRARAAAERLRRARGTGDGPMPTEQLIRAAQAAVEAGSTEKAIELYELLQARHAPVPGIDAWLVWLRWQNGVIEDDAVFEELEAAQAKGAGDRQATSIALMLKGHVHRFTGAFGKAAEAYKEATRQDTNNEQAFRWYRYCAQRAGQRKSGHARPAEGSGARSETGFFGRLFGRGRS